MTLALTTFAVFTACEDEVSYTPAEPESGVANIVFAGASSQTFEVEPGVTSFKLELERAESESGSEETVNLLVRNNQDNVFVCPATATFAAGATTTDITVNVNNAEEGVYYNLVLCLEGTLSDYTQGNRQKEISFAIMKWENIGTGYWVGNAVGHFYGVDQLNLAVEIEKAVTSTSTRFRFSSPYASVMTGSGLIGDSDYEWYKGYPYNDPADVVAGNYTFLIICDTKGEASLAPVNMGMDWGYGMFSTGSIYGYLSNDKDSYPLGKYDATKGMITFPANSLYSSMAGYNNGGKYPISNNPAYLYLSDKDFLTNQVKETNYDEDFEWKAVEEATGTFVSASADASWVQTVEVAVDEKGLYRFPSLYANGKNIVFYYDEKEQLITMPKRQETGMYALGGSKIFVDCKSGKADENMEMTLNMNFYTVDEDGNIAVDFGTLTETFKWGVTGVLYSDLVQGKSIEDYQGYWQAPFYNLKDGKQVAAVVAVQVSEEYENTLEVYGLSGIDPEKYNDLTYVDYDSKTGLLMLQPQDLAQYGEYDMVLATLNVATGSMSTEDVLVGGLTADGVFAFVNSPENKQEVNSIGFAAFSGGKYQGLLSTYIPYPMEWSSYEVSAASAKGLGATPMITQFEKVQQQKSFSNKLQGTPINGKKTLRVISTKALR